MASSHSSEIRHTNEQTVHLVEKERDPKAPLQSGKETYRSDGEHPAPKHYQIDTATASDSERKTWTQYKYQEHFIICSFGWCKISSRKHPQHPRETDAWEPRPPEHEDKVESIPWAVKVILIQRVGL